MIYSEKPGLARFPALLVKWLLFASKIDKSDSIGTSPHTIGQVRQAACVNRRKRRLDIRVCWTNRPGSLNRAFIEKVRAQDFPGTQSRPPEALIHSQPG
jgi:hypothetical protein